ncbi:MAG: hypothetical protein IJS94_04210, partial [Clostridia bacterium]|nr:hypothetical protein [Clostridia bacterium]
MKNKTVKILVLCLCAALLSGIICSVAFAAGGNEKEEKTETAVKSADTAPDSAKASKDETVYVIADADGAVQKIIVSDWIKNTLGSASVNDSTALNDIVNVKGDETYTVGGNESRVWDAQGNDIYYQGNIDRELPVARKVSYLLDGKSVTPDELKGKSGKVTIRFDYENKQYETVKINGKDEKIYVPFAMLT